MSEKNEIGEWTVNGIGVVDARMISEALKCNRALTILDLKGDEWTPSLFDYKNYVCCKQKNTLGMKEQEW